MRNDKEGDREEADQDRRIDEKDRNHQRHPSPQSTYRRINEIGKKDRRDQNIDDGAYSDEYFDNELAYKEDQYEQQQYF